MKTTNQKFIKESLIRVTHDFFVFAKTTDGTKIMISDLEEDFDDEYGSMNKFTAYGYNLDEIETIFGIEPKRYTASEIESYYTDKAEGNAAPVDLLEKINSGFVAVELTDGSKGWIVEYDDSHADEYGEAKVCVEFLNSQYQYIFVSNIAKIIRFVEFK